MVPQFFFCCCFNMKEHQVSVMYLCHSHLQVGMAGNVCDELLSQDYFSVHVLLLWFSFTSSTLQTHFPLNGNLIRYVRFMYHFLNACCVLVHALSEKRYQTAFETRFVTLQILWDLFQTSDSECVLNSQSHVILVNEVLLCHNYFKIVLVCR